jgi:hypothetical protein
MSWKLILISDGLGEEWLSVCIRLCSFLVEAVFTSGPTVIWHQILLPISMSISWCWILNSMQSCSFPSIFKVYPILMILPYLWHSLVFGLCSCCAQILPIFSVPVLWIWSFFLVWWIPNCACIFHCRSNHGCICCWLYRLCAVFKVSADKS